MAVVVKIWTVKHIFGQRMRLRIRDKTADIGHKSIVLGVSIHTDHIVKTLLLNATKTEEGHVLAHVPSLAVSEKGFPSSRGGRGILSGVLPVEQISDRPMLAVVFEIPLVITQDLRFVCTEITARYHRQIIWI